jgi:hypothetical protein
MTKTELNSRSHTLDRCSGKANTSGSRVRTSGSRVRLERGFPRLRVSQALAGSPSRHPTVDNALASRRFGLPLHQFACQQIARVGRRRLASRVGQGTRRHTDTASILCFLSVDPQSCWLFVGESCCDHLQSCDTDARFGGARTPLASRMPRPSEETGGLSKNPCASSHSRSRRNSHCSGVSTPSATTPSLRL